MVPFNALSFSYAFCMFFLTLEHRRSWRSPKQTNCFRTHLVALQSAKTGVSAKMQLDWALEAFDARPIDAATAEPSKRLWCGHRPFRKHAILQVRNFSDFSKSGRSSVYWPRKRIAEEQLFERIVSFAIFLFSRSFPRSIAVRENGHSVDRKKINNQESQEPHVKNVVEGTLLPPPTPPKPPTVAQSRKLHGCLWDGCPRIYNNHMILYYYNMLYIFYLFVILLQSDDLLIQS